MRRWLRFGPAQLALIAALALVALLTYTLARERATAITVAQAETRNFARVLEEHARQTLRLVDISLAQADAALARLRRAGNFDPAQARQVLTELLPLDRRVRSFLVLDRGGNVVLSTAADEATAGESRAGHDYFVPHVRGADRELVFGVPERSTVDGAWLLPVSRRISAPAGEYVGVLVAMVPIAYFQPFYDSIDRGPDGFVALFLSGGWAAVSSSDDRALVNRDWSQAPMFREHVPGWPTGTVREPGPWDDIERIYSYRALNDYPVVVAFGRSAASTLAAWRWTAWRDGLLLLTGLLALAGVTRAVIRHDRSRRVAEATLAESQARYRLLIEHSPVGIALLQHGLLVYVNPALVGILGAGSASELVGQPILNSVHANCREAVARCVADLEGVPAAPVMQQEEVLLRADGRQIDAELRWAVIPYGGEAAIQISVIDITERKTAQDSIREARTFLEAAVAQSPSGILIADAPDVSIRMANQAALAIRGGDQGHLIGIDVSRHAANWQVHRPDGSPYPSESLPLSRAVLQGQTTSNEELIIRDESGKERWISANAAPIRGGDGEISAGIVVFHDITERKEAERALGESERRFSDLLSNVHLLAVMLDAKGNISFCNDFLLELTGWQRNEVIGHDWFAHFLPEAVRAPVRAMFLASLQSGRIAEHYENEIITRNGEQRLIVWDNTLLRDARGQIVGTASLGVDISARKQAEELIWKQANFDFLTDLPNRRMFRDRLTQEIKKANRTGHRLALLFIDLDNFKEINDTLGHPVGDLLLVEAARRIAGCVRDTDTVARLGGDEFTVLLTELADLDDVERVALAILKQLAEAFRLADEVVVISASIGITLYPNDATDIDELLKGADQAMYAAKNTGRNRHSYFTQTLQEAARNRLRLINDLRGAVTGEQLRVHFQPIVSLASGHIHKAEALVRWQHPGRGLVSPAEFVPLAEETGLIVDIGNWVFHEAARWSRRWRSLHHERFQVSVNMSPAQFERDAAQHDWLGHLLAIGLSGQGIVVEITEGLLLNADAPIMASLLAYRDAGIQVAIDDFGTGYSSLSYLNKFDIDYLKIDQAFIRNLAPGTSDMALSEAIIVMAHKLGLQVIAEGVETVEQRDLLVAAGCDYGQGYLFSRPLPPEDFETLLSR